MSSITFPSRNGGNVIEGRDFNSANGQQFAILDNVWEVIQARYPTADPTRSILRFNLQLVSGTAEVSDFNQSNLNLSYSIQLNGRIQSSSQRAIDDSEIEGNETFSFQPKFGDLWLRTSNSTTIAFLNQDQLNGLFASAGGLTFNAGLITGTIIDNELPNQAPTVANPIADQAAAEDAAFNFTFAANTFADVDGDPLSYTATLANGDSLPSWLIFDAATRTFSGTPEQANVGNLNVTVTATDPRGGNISDTFALNVTNTNDAATISGTRTGAVTEDTNVTNGDLTTTGTLTVTDPDIGQNQFDTTVTAPPNTTNLGSLSITDTGTWSYSVANSAVQSLGAGATRTDTFTVQSVDGTASQDITLTITGVNDTATISGTRTGAVTEDANVGNGNLTTTGTLTVSDPDNGQNQFDTTVTAPPNTTNLGSLSITDTGTWSYSVANSAVQFLGAGVTKTDTFTVQSSDGTASQNIVVTLTGVNDAPTAGTDTVTATQGTGVKISAATLLANDSDVDTGDILRITAAGTTGGGSVAFNNNGTPSNFSDDFITFNPTSGGNNSFTYTLGDGKGGTTLGSVNVLTGTRQLGGNGKDTLTGNSGPDFLDGGNGDDTLFGNAGNDILLGGGNGDDLLVGGTGADTLTGGNGADTFRFALTDSLLPNVDRITDFVIGTDILDGPNAVSAANLQKLGSAASLSASDVGGLLTTTNFVANSAATFSFGSSRFVALNDGTAGFNATNDALIEITGFSGNINSLAIA